MNGCQVEKQTELGRRPWAVHWGVRDSSCCCSVAKSCPLSFCDLMNYSTPDFSVLTISWSLLKFMSIGSVMPSNRLNLCNPLCLLSSIFPSIRVFSKESALCIRWPNYWGFSINISPSNEYSGLVSFRIGWLHLLAVQGTLKSLIQHHISKASILWPSAFLWSNSHIHTRLLEKPYLGTIILPTVILKEMEYQTTWSASWEICMQVRKQQLELDMEQQTGSK